MARWKVTGPYGARQARSWPLALDFVCQDIKTLALTLGATETQAEESAWGAVRHHAEDRAPFSVATRGHTFKVERQP